jgi:glucose/arabinose dehydrogenase
MPSVSVGTRRRWAVAVLLAVGALVGCDAGGPGNDSPAPSIDSPASSISATPSALSSTAAASRPSGSPDLAAGELVAEGIEVPWGLAFLPDGDALVAERDTGRVLRVTPGKAPRSVYEVPGVTPSGEGGLLGLAVSPTFATDDLVYAYVTAEADNRIVSFRLDGGAPKVVFDGIAKAGFHNGGRIAFGPDGLLYVGTGDAGVTSRAQDPGSPNGKVLRMTAAGAPAPGNPTAGSPVYSLGHRNVQGLAWDSAGRLFATEFGQNELDEVNRIEPGRNYGWPEVEGQGDTDGGKYTNPLVTWPTDAASPSGIAIAGATAYVAALRGERLWTIPVVGNQLGKPVAQFDRRYGRLRTVQVAPDGALWLTTSNTDGRGDVRAGDDRILRFPAR